MALSDCSKCWETPCICNDGAGYKHLSINELSAIKTGIEKLLADKIKRHIAPDKREHSL